MMEWPEHLRDWVLHAGDFADSQLVALAHGHESLHDGISPALLEQMRDLGFHNLCAPEHRGGLQADASILAAVLYPLAQQDATTASIVYASAAAWHVIAEQDNARLSPDLLDGWLAWPAFHDVHEQAWPEVDGQGNISGSAELLLAGTFAGSAVLPARDKRTQKLLYVLVRLAQPGVSRSKAVRTLGLSAAGIVDITFSNAKGKRLKTDVDTFPRIHTDRLLVAAAALSAGVIAATIATVDGYVQERQQGGGRISGWGEVRRLLAEMHQQGDVVDTLLMQMLSQPATHPDQHHRYLVHINLLATAITANGVQLLGGNGYMKDYGQEKRMRDVRQLKCVPSALTARHYMLGARAATTLESNASP